MTRFPPALVAMLLLAAGLTAAADPPAKAVRFPDAVAPAPTPMPPPAPDAVTRLAADQTYVIDSDVPLLVLASPEGVVTCMEKAGPVEVRGRFVDSPSGRAEWKTFNGKHVYFLDAAHTGKVELLVVPVGATAARDVIRKRLDVDAGEAPRPPPTPDVDPPKPPPGPTPTPNPAPIPAAGLHVLIVYESAELSKLPPAQLNVIYSQTVRGYLNAKCPPTADGKAREWNMWDKDVDTAEVPKKWQDAMRRPRTSVPWVIVSNGTAGEEVPLPETVEKMMALLKKYGE